VSRFRGKNLYLSEHHSFGESEDIAGDYAEELAAEMLATTLGLEFDPDKAGTRRRGLPPLEPDRPLQHDANRCGRQERPLDHRRRGCRPNRERVIE
jgi:hypothetical protein